jgi:CBS domain-containing protein
MIELHVRHLPVVKGGRVVGFLSARDLLPIEKGPQAELASLAFEPW